jgi:hypothetical protein
MEMLPVSVILIVISFYCESQAARWVLVVSALPAFISVAGMLVGFTLFYALDCTGSIIDVHVCPPGATETIGYALMRPAVLSMFYGTFAAIGVSIVGGIVAAVAEVAKRMGLDR